MKKKTETIIKYIFGSLCAFLVCFIILGFILSLVEENKEDNFCEEIFTSPLKEYTMPGRNSWASDITIEEGYVKCCRRYWNNHEIDNECKVFPYHKK